MTDHADSSDAPAGPTERPTTPLVRAPVPGTVGCPYRTATLPPIGGHLSGEPEDFVVDELPAYTPEGIGEHWFVRVRKVGLSTEHARRALAKAAGISHRTIGAAGRKDTVAVTTQWMSLPVEPVAPDDERITLLEQTRHPRKLRMGHLAGNRFTITLRGLHPEAAERLPALLDAIAQGVPNYYGPQRFGHGGRSLRQALGLRDKPRRRVRDPRFLVSVLQSAIFNHWLGARVADGLLDRAIVGDVLRKRDTGGLFNCEDLEADDPRVASGAVDPMGPMPGARMMPAVDQARSRELVSCEAWGTDLELRPLHRLAPGTRRIARVVPADLEAAIEGEALQIAFTLPAGAYATTVLAELSHPPGGDLRGPVEKD